MGFSLFGSSGDNKTSTTTNTRVEDSSANASNGGLAVTKGGQLTINSVDSAITKQAFDFGSGALAANTDVSKSALASGLASLQISSNLVPDLLKAQKGQNSDVLKAAQQNVNLASQLASQGAGLARGAQTGGASTLLEGPVPYVVGAVILGSLYFFSRKAH